MKKRLLLLLICIVSAGMAFAQIKVTGTVIDDQGEAVIGATIIIKGTTTGTVTDIDGKFELSNVNPKSVLEVSYLGYKTEQVAPKSSVRVTLHEDAKVLDDVVVTGMMVQDKRTLAGATTKISAEDSQLAGVADVSRSLEGRSSGVSVQNVSGTFGTAPKIRVRGATSIYGASKPLWVVDGVVLEDAVEMSADDLSSGDASTLIASAISGINSDDIESFQILKDGSATSIYGARAMAGVIVVTTKKGKAGHGSLNYTGEFTYRMKPSYKDYNICNSQEQMGIYQELSEKGWLEASNLNISKNSGVYGKMYQLIKTYDPATGTFAMANTTAARNAYLREAEFRNTDWFDLLFNNNIMQNHSISFSAGTERAQTRASLSVMHDPGWYKSSSVQRYTANMNASYDIIPKQLKISINTNGSYRKQKAPGTTNQSTDAVTGAVSREFDINPFSYSMNTSRALDPNTNYRRNYCDFNIFDELKQNYIDIAVTDVKFQGELDYKPKQVPGLTFHLLGSIRYQKSEQEQHVKDDSNQARAYRAGVDDYENDQIRDANSYLYTDPDVSGALPETVLPQGGIYTVTGYKLLSTDFRGTVQYSGAWKGSESPEDHVLNLFAGAESNSTDRQYTWFRGWGYQYNNGGIPYYDYKIFKQGQEEGTNYYYNEYTYYRNLAFFGNANYSFRHRYSLNGTIRYEGTNKLGKSRQARWLPTWNVSASWDLGGEKWFRDAMGYSDENGRPHQAWSTATLRASYSLTADRGPSSVTNSLAVFQATTPYRPLASVTETAIGLAALENSELTYEKKHELNIGANLGFIDDRINLEFDWYTRNNYDLIGYVQTAGVGGEITKLANAASMKSSGVEFTLSTLNINRQNFKWNTDFIFSYATNEITDLQAISKVSSLVSGQGYALEGYPVRALFSIPFAGLTEDGLPTFYSNKEHTETYNPTNYSDINFQEYNDIDYLTYEGSVDPKFTGSLNNTFTLWKNLKLSIFLTYSFGNVLRLNDLCPVYSSQYSDLTASMKEMKNRWMTPGDENTTTIPVIASKRQYQTISGLSYAYSAYNYSTERVAKGDFIRLKEISLQYDFPKEWFAKQKCVNSFSVKLSGTNLALLYADKKLNGQDPEYYSSGGVSSPVPRQFTLTLRMGL